MTDSTTNTAKADTEVPANRKMILCLHSLAYLPVYQHNASATCFNWTNINLQV